MSEEIIDLFPLKLDKKIYFQPYDEVKDDKGHRYKKNSCGYLLRAYENFKLAADFAGLAELFPIIQRQSVENAFEKSMSFCYYYYFFVFVNLNYCHYVIFR